MMTESIIDLFKIIEINYDEAELLALSLATFIALITDMNHSL